jgi:hypothetical protein
MEAIEGSYRACAGKTSAAEDVAYYKRNVEMKERLFGEVWNTFSTTQAKICLPDNWVYQKDDFVTGLSSCFPTRSLEPPLYDQPPPPYDDVIRDLPPEYSALPPLAQRKSTAVSFAPKTRGKSHNPSSSLLKDQMLDVRIDFENPIGAREHKKKKPAAAKKPIPPPSPPPPPPPPAGGDGGGDDNSNGDGGDGGNGGDSGGAGDGDGGDGGDDWGDWNVSGKKDKKKKKLEEEEEERKAKEEEEKKAKEEEERQAKEEEERLAKEEEERKAAEASAAKDLSWAEDNGGGGDDSWATFTNVGKKKKGKVRPSSSDVQDGCLSKITGRSCTAWGVPGCKS